MKKKYSDGRHASSLSNLYTWCTRRLSKNELNTQKVEQSYLFSVTAVLESSGPTIEKFKMVEQFGQQLVPIVYNSVVLWETWLTGHAYIA